MPEIPCYQVDAFTRHAFRGSPAAVCPLETWLPDALLEAIAAENSVPETAFFVPRPGSKDDFDLRWMTPVVEVDLCGHATLATAFVLMTILDPTRTRARFHTLSGALDVTRDRDGFTLDFPSRPPLPSAHSSIEAVTAALGARPMEVSRARDELALFETAEEVRALRPDFARIATLETFALIATAPGTGIDADVDFVSRFFAPRQGLDEDPVTGSAHCSLAPFWAQRLDKTSLAARQVSKRSGELRCALVRDRVLITGHAVLVKTGTLHLPEAHAQLP
jgi:PhzF family phenazine biosynthesis protein